MTKHQDCRCYIPIDVEKGICNKLKVQVPASDQSCPNMILLAKCKNCKNFSDVKEDGMGQCTGFENEYWSYSELRGALCENYVEA